LKGLQFDLILSQESASKAKDQNDEVQEAPAALKLVQQDLLEKLNELNIVMSNNIRLEIELTSPDVDLTKLKETLASVSNENSQLATDVEDLLSKRNFEEKELEEK